MDSQGIGVAGVMDSKTGKALVVAYDRLGSPPP